MNDPQECGCQVNREDLPRKPVGWRPGPPADVERHDAVSTRAEQLWCERLLWYVRDHYGMHVGVTRDGEEYVSSSLVELENLMAESHPEGGYFVGSIFLGPDTQ